MQERILESLTLENEDYFFTGHLTITGNVNISNGNIIVAGNLTIKGNVNIENGSLIVSKTLTFISTSLSNVSITSGDICAEFLISDKVSITVIDGDISIFKNLDCKCPSIYTDGNIKVNGDSTVRGGIECLNYLIEGNTDFYFIFAKQDVYIGGNVDSGPVRARDFLVLGDIILNLSSVVVKNFYCSGEVLDGEVIIE